MASFNFQIISDFIYILNSSSTFLGDCVCIYILSVTETAWHSPSSWICDSFPFLKGCLSSLTQRTIVCLVPLLLLSRCSYFLSVCIKIKASTKFSCKVCVLWKGQKFNRPNICAERKQPESNVVKSFTWFNFSSDYFIRRVVFALCHNFESVWVSLLCLHGVCVFFYYVWA